LVYKAALPMKKTGKTIYHEKVAESRKKLIFLASPTQLQLGNCASEGKLKNGSL
jgi:hypothetical protein